VLIYIRFNGDRSLGVLKQSHIEFLYCAPNHEIKTDKNPKSLTDPELALGGKAVHACKLAGAQPVIVSHRLQ